MFSSTRQRTNYLELVIPAGKYRIDSTSLPSPQIVNLNKDSIDVRRPPNSTPIVLLSSQNNCNISTKLII